MDQRVETSRGQLLNKVPAVTAFFWVIKVLCTTVGETAADFLNVSLGLGLSGTSVVTGGLLLLSLVLQFAARRYVAARYWLAVTLVSVFGTLVTDNLSDVGVPLEASAVCFAVLLALTFLLWFSREGTLSIHSIVTRRREAFYWLAILFTFALGTATGDLMAEVLGLGYAVAGAIVAGVIVVIAVGWRLGLDPVLAFWIIYVLTRPLGASIGDYLSQSPAEGGLGWGPTVTSVVFLVAILAIVGYLSATRADVVSAHALDDEEEHRGALVQTVVVLAVLLVASGVGYAVRSAALQADTAAPATVVAAPAAAAPGGAAPAAPSPVARLGDLSTFRTISQDTLSTLDGGDQAGATARVADLETEWDKAQARLKPRDGAAWTLVDGKIDTVLRELRSSSPDAAGERAALQELLTVLG